jgi:thiol-disulfide isomerase/thioredoxin
MARPEFYSGKILYPAIAALIALSALFALGVMPRLWAPGGKLLNQPAPDFTLPVAANGDDGARLQLSDLRDKVVVLDFWASWCGPCAMQAPILDRIARKYEGEVVVLGINVGESAAVARRYASQKGLSYMILADEDGQTQALYGADTLPTVVLIDRQGNITTFVQGVVRQSALERAIRSL